MLARGFLIEILLHIHNMQQRKIISGFLINFYYSGFLLFPNTYSNLFLMIKMSQL